MDLSHGLLKNKSVENSGMIRPGKHLVRILRGVQRKFLKKPTRTASESFAICFAKMGFTFEKENLFLLLVISYMLWTNLSRTNWQLIKSRNRCEKSLTPGIQAWFIYQRLLPTDLRKDKRLILSKIWCPALWNNDRPKNIATHIENLKEKANHKYNRQCLPKFSHLEILDAN